MGWSLLYVCTLAVQGEIVEVERRRSRHLPIEQWLEVVEGISGREELPARDSSAALPR